MPKTKNASEKKGKKMSDWKKYHGHFKSDTGRLMASKYQQENTEYAPRKSVSYHKKEDMYVAHVSNMSGMQYGHRSGRDEQGRSYSSEYRGRKVGYVGTYLDSDKIRRKSYLKTGREY